MICVPIGALSLSPVRTPTIRESSLLVSLSVVTISSFRLLLRAAASFCGISISSATFSLPSASGGFEGSVSLLAFFASLISCSILSVGLDWVWGSFFDNLYDLILPVC